MTHFPCEFLATMMINELVTVRLVKKRCERWQVAFLLPFIFENGIQFITKSLFNSHFKKIIKFLPIFIQILIEDLNKSIHCHIVSLQRFFGIFGLLILQAPVIYCFNGDLLGDEGLSKLVFDALGSSHHCLYESELFLALLSDSSAMMKNKPEPINVLFHL